MAKPSIKSVAVVGTGVIGRSWIQVFARAGCAVRVFDADPIQVAGAMSWVEADLKALRKEGGIKKKEARARRDRVRVAASLAEAVDGAGYIQESGPESLEIKQSLYREIDSAAGPEAIVASSTSAMDMTDIASELKGAHRCIVAHPINPPHVVPAVEILGGAATQAQVVHRTVEFMRELGQTPVLMRRFVPGFVVNRLQAALIREAVDLVSSGVCDVRAVDDSIRDGLGLRWALMGPYGVANTNADGGVQEYFTRFRQAYHDIWAALNTDVRLDDDLVARLGVETDAMLPAPLPVQRAWRDRLVGAIRRLKADDPLRGSKKKAKRRAR